MMEQPNKNLHSSECRHRHPILEATHGDDARSCCINRWVPENIDGTSGGWLQTMSVLMLEAACYSVHGKISKPGEVSR